MASDSRGTLASNIPYHCEKLYRIRGRLVGVCGEDKGTLAYVEFFTKGGKPDDWEFSDASALVLCPKRGILHYDASGRPDPVKESFFAIGSGAQVALGAMEHGATAAEAVAAACRWNTECGLPVVSMHIGTRNVRRRKETGR